MFTAILLFVLGAAFFLIVPALNARIAVGTADLAPTLATSVNVTAYTLSIIVASGVARLAVGGGAGLQGLVLLSALSRSPRSCSRRWARTGGRPFSRNADVQTLGAVKGLHSPVLAAHRGLFHPNESVAWF